MPTAFFFKPVFRASGILELWRRIVNKIMLASDTDNNDSQKGHYDPESGKDRETSGKMGTYLKHCAGPFTHTFSCHLSTHPGR